MGVLQVDGSHPGVSTGFEGSVKPGLDLYTGNTGPALIAKNPAELCKLTLVITALKIVKQISMVQTQMAILKSW